MSATMTKKFSIGMLAVLLMSFLMMFSTGIQAYAEEAPVPADSPSKVSKGDDIGGVVVEVGQDGKLSISGNENFNNGGSSSAWNSLFKKYRTFIVGLSGIGAISMIAFFVMQFMKLGASAGNPQARSQALAGVLWTGLAAAGLGAVTIVVGFFYNAIK